ncbi:PhoD-like phosphatase N-terminal domain-containing protein [Coleofasciculus sp. F4-SAH-05]|uniref:PhoD-like phosphatase N-terminal domain-containing protein n=1 Tax=Coleofasciculus TaxID=669368 RepID=UPI0032F9AFC5
MITANLLSKSGLAQSTAPGMITSDKIRPQTPYGVASGDVSRDQAVIWSKSDRASRMIVDYDTSESFSNPQRVMGSTALESVEGDPSYLSGLGFLIRLSGSPLQR